MQDDEPEMPYLYLVSYTGTKNRQTAYGHCPLKRDRPFTMAELGSVMDFIQEENDMDNRPVILGVFTFADSADAAVQV